jgi:hypothetical protein
MTVRLLFKNISHFTENKLSLCRFVNDQTLTTLTDE